MRGRYGMKKVFILDTNVLLSNPLSIHKFDDNDVVIPISVIEEVDTFKKDMSDIGRNAREVSRILDKLRDRGTLSSGIPIFEDKEDSGQLFVYLGHNMEILPELLADSTDNHILAIALTLQKQFGDSRRVSVITKDTNLRIKADAFGLVAEDFAADKMDISHLYTGVVEVSVLVFVHCIQSRAHNTYSSMLLFQARCLYLNCWKNPKKKFGSWMGIS